MSAGEGDALLAMSLFAADPQGLSGVVLRSAAGPQRDELLDWLRAHLPALAPMLSLPHHTTDDRLLGGLSLAATLHEGRVVMERGLLALADRGVIVAPMAERMSSLACTYLCTALDHGSYALERDGTGQEVTSRIGVVLLDEGIGDERAPAPLLDRLPFWVDLGATHPRARLTVDDLPATTALLSEARARLPRVAVSTDIVRSLCEAASALGIASVRAPLMAVRTARVHAALFGRLEAEEQDAIVAARLVLGPRATCVPVVVDEPEPVTQRDPRSDDASAVPTSEDATSEEPPRPASSADTPLADVVLAAAKSGIPEGVLDQIALGRDVRAVTRRAGASGIARASQHGGRPRGTRAKIPSSGERLDVVETLRAAAPWQRIREREHVARTGHASGRRVLVRMQDLRVVHREERSESVVIFSVDASGSAALQRLSEAKGAVEQVLADCYVRRDQVALLAFRGAGATLLLPPTRSLARARRCLADLAGGGGTPLAAGIDAARTLALAAKKSGKTPLVVLMTDARANVARDGREGSGVALEDAHAGACLLRDAGIASLFLDTSPRPRAQARQVASWMGARYLHLPYVDAARISHQVRQLAETGTR